MAAIHWWDPGVMWTKSLRISPNPTLILMPRVAFASSVASFLPAWLNYLRLEFTALNRAFCCGWALILCCRCCFESTLDALFHIQVHVPESVSLQMFIQLAALRTHWQSVSRVCPFMLQKVAGNDQKWWINRPMLWSQAFFFSRMGYRCDSAFREHFRLLLNMV